MAERGAFEDAMDAAFANVRWMQVDAAPTACRQQQPRSDL
jgi:hypothetical protein